MLKFIWDERKNQANYRKHGFSFANAWEIFAQPVLIELDERLDYEEKRWVGIGLLRSRFVVIVYTEPDEETIRIISLRKALRYEQLAYEQAFGKRLGTN